MLEGLHLLADAVLEHIEILHPQIGDGDATARRIDVDAHVIHLGGESRRRLRLG